MRFAVKPCGIIVESIRNINRFDITGSLSNTQRCYQIKCPLVFCDFVIKYRLFTLVLYEIVREYNGPNPTEINE